MRTIGSSSGLYTDPGLLLSERATRLLRDTANAIHERILEAYTEPSDAVYGQDITNGLDQLLDAANSLVIDGALTREEALQSSIDTNNSAQAGLQLSTSKDAWLVDFLRLVPALKLGH